jgi:hypothetical protein
LCAWTSAATSASWLPTSPVAGTVTSIGLTILPSADLASTGSLSEARPDTGTAMASASVNSPLAVSTRRSAPATPTNMASFVVPP